MNAQLGEIENKGESEIGRTGVECEANSVLCQPAPFILFNSLQHDNYRIIVELLNLSPQDTSLFKGIQFRTRVVNHDYINFLIVLRYCCLLVGLAATLVMYALNVRTSVARWTWEHKFFMKLSIAQFVFNEPLYYVSINHPSMPWAVFSILSVNLFISMLAYFWLVLFRRIHQEISSPDTKLNTLRSKIAIVALYALLCVYTIYGSYINWFKINYQSTDDYPAAYIITEVVVLLYVGSIVIYILFNIYWICRV